MPRLFTVLFLTFAACTSEPRTVTGPQGPAGEKGEKGDAIVGPQGPTGLQGGSTVKSGTRLKARVLRSEDGASQFLGWWDSELKTRCWDSEGRCVPSVAGRVAADSETATFADDACRTHAVFLTAQNRHEGASYCSVADSDGAAWFPLGVELDTIYRLTDEACTRDTSRDHLDVSYHRCGDLPEVPRDAFAAMFEEVEG